MKTREDFDTAEEYIAYLEATNASMRKGNGLRMKVSEKGALSVYGMGKFPFTLYKSQWHRLFANAQEILDFAKANDHLLTDKRETKAAA